MEEDHTNVRMSDSIKNISKALVGAQADVGKALKNQKNTHFKSQYADLSAVLEVSKPALAKHGLALAQFPGEAEGRLTMSTMLIHESGEWIQLPPASIPIQAQTAHGFGSAISYLRRYTTQAILAISVGLDDDDGNEATAQAPKRKPKKKATASQLKKARVELLEILETVKDDTTSTIDSEHILGAEALLTDKESSLERLQSAKKYLENNHKSK